jgi:integrase
MNAHQQAVLDLIKDRNTPAIVRLRNKVTEPFSAEDIDEIEKAILDEITPAHRLDKLLPAAYALIAELDSTAASVRFRPVAYQYPQYNNVLADGFRTAEENFREARSWLERRASIRAQRPNGDASPVLLLAELVVSLVVEFQVLSKDTISALMESLRDGRVVSTDRHVAIPVSLGVGHQEHAMDRWIVVPANRRELLEHLRGDDDVMLMLSRLNSHRSPNDGLAEFESELANAGADAIPITLDRLIEAARQLAILHMPTAVVAHRAGITISHALRLDVMERVGRLRPVPRFPVATLRNGSQAVDDAEDPDPEDEVPPPAWLNKLRAAVKRDGIEAPELNKLAKGDDVCGRRVAEYVLYLDGKQFGASTIHRYAFLIANRLMPRLKDSDPTGLDEDKWEDLVEQILDDDAFYRRRRYSEDRAIAPIEYSRPLLRALRSYVTYLNQRNQAPGGMGSFLPSSGIVRVESALVTVDEFEAALDYLRGSDVDAGYLSDAAVTALILGFRLGIRRAECQYLRVCDFGPPVAPEEAAAANLHLRVRPWMLHKLKTSNARRDLPLVVLIPPDELAIVLRFVNKARKRGANAHLFAGIRDTSKVLKFDRVIALLEEAFRGRGTKPLVPDFHYHLLRHSFANMCLLRLSPHLGPVARQILRHHPKTLELIKDTDGFRMALLATDRVQGTDLQAIALLMGHGSAATTVEHYIHILDWWT